MVLEDIEWIYHKICDGDEDSDIDVESWAFFSGDYSKMSHEEFIQSHLEVCKEWNKDMGFKDHSQYIHAFTIKFKNEEPVTVEVKDEKRTDA